MKNFILFITVIVMMIFTVSHASAVILTVGSDSGDTDETLSIPITVDDPTGIAGAAFSLVFSDSLSVSVESSFFDTFINQFSVCGLTPEEIDEIEIPVGYSQPLVTNEVSGPPNHMKISAARCMPAPPDASHILFTLEVSLKNGEPAGVYTLEIVPTTLINTDAGYADEGEAIDLLIGSNPNEPMTSPTAFPVILDDSGYAANIVNGSVTFSVPFVDTDDDGMDDNWEIDNFGDLSHDGTDDSDHDGYSDKNEYDNQTDPEVRDEPGFYIGYDPCTDGNALKQQVSLAPDASIAYPGGTITISIDYDVSDGNDTLSGLGIYLHFDSSKVAYSGFDDFLYAGDIIQEPNAAVILNDLSDTDNDPDTDKMMLISWGSSANNWPNRALSVKLCDLNFSVDEALTPGDVLMFAVTESATDADYVFCGTNTEAAVADLPISPPPTGVAASDNTFSGMVQVTWNASPGATSYDVYRGDMPAWTGTMPTRIASSIIAASYDDLTAVSGNRYYYWVKSRSPGGVSKFSHFDPGYWGSLGSIPPVPQDVFASDGTVTGMVSITWAATSNTLVYEIWRNDIPAYLGGKMTKIGISTTTSFDDVAVVEGNRYYYWVKARNSWGVSRYSKFNTGYMGAEFFPLPAPTGVNATDGALSGKVNITWNAVSGAVVYEVWRATDLVGNGGTPRRIGFLPGLTFDDTSGTAGTVYYYWVKTINCWGSSRYSVPNSGYHN